MNCIKGCVWTSKVRDYLVRLLSTAHSPVIPEQRRAELSDAADSRTSRSILESLFREPLIAGVLPQNPRRLFAVSVFSKIIRIAVQLGCVAAIAVGCGLLVFNNIVFGVAPLDSGNWNNQEAAVAKLALTGGVAAGLVTVGILGLLVTYANAFFLGRRSDAFGSGRQQAG